jgi:hypothetical protein
MSNKVVRHRDGVFVTWLDDCYRIVLAQVDPDTGTVVTAFPLAQGIDNHCGAALTLGADGALHVMAGAHGTNGFIHRFSATPADPASWSLAEAVGAASTYPSLVTARNGDLVLAYRHTALQGSWSTCVIRRPRGGAWSWCNPLVAAPAPGYTFPTNSLSVGPDGTLHLLLEFFKTFPENRDASRSMAVTHLQSCDNGVTWLHDDGRPVKSTPIGIEDCTLIDSDPAGSLRPANLVALADGRLWCGIWNQFTGAVWLLRRDAPGRWTRVDLDAAIAMAAPARVLTSQPCLTVDRDGSLLAVCTVAPTLNWAHPENELLCLWLDPATGALRRHWRVPKADPAQSNWLPSVERGDGPTPAHSPVILFTDGNRGEGLVNSARTRVRMIALPGTDKPGKSSSTTKHAKHAKRNE